MQRGRKPNTTNKDNGSTWRNQPPKEIADDAAVEADHITIPVATWWWKSLVKGWGGRRCKVGCRGVELILLVFFSYYSLYYFSSTRSTNNEVQDPTQDLSSPYYVHPCDGHHYVIIKPRLNTSNSQAWARTMHRGLGGKDNLQFVDGTIVPPQQDHLSFSTYERCNNFIHSWIMNSISDSISLIIVYIDNISDVFGNSKLWSMIWNKVQILSMITMLSYGLLGKNLIAIDVHLHAPVLKDVVFHQCAMLEILGMRIRWSGF